MVDFSLESEENRVNWAILNAYLNGLGYEEYRQTEDETMPPYDYYAEAILWAKSKDYFPDLPEEDVLAILRKYDIWNLFEEEYLKKQ